MSVENCETALRTTAGELRSILDPLGFRFYFDQAGQGHQPFASGYFVRDEVRIGLIYRVNSKLGAVVYENNTTSVLHDNLMSSLGFAAEQHLRYDDTAFQSVAVDGGSAVEALCADLRTLSPILRNQKTLSLAITEARHEAESIANKSAAAKKAKLEAWLRRRSSPKA
jgi:hypothetical protein